MSRRLLEEVLPAPLTFSKALVFVDYDGTLVSIQNDPQAAQLGAAELDILRNVASIPSLQLVVISGRPKSFLTDQLRGVPITMGAEHGAFLWEPKLNDWQGLSDNLKLNLSEEVESQLAKLTAAIPGSAIEHKDSCTAWHYRNSVNPDLTAIKSAITEITVLLPPNLTLVTGKCILEIRQSNISKGGFMDSYIKRNSIAPDDTHVIAIGDDTTDEDMFQLVNSIGGQSIKVGNGDSLAKFRFSSHLQTYLFLKELADELS